MQLKQKIDSGFNKFIEDKELVKLYEERIFNLDISSDVNHQNEMK